MSPPEIFASPQMLPSAASPLCSTSGRLRLKHTDLGPVHGTLFRSYRFSTRTPPNVASPSPTIHTGGWQYRTLSSVEIPSLRNTQAAERQTCVPQSRLLHAPWLLQLLLVCGVYSTRGFFFILQSTQIFILNKRDKFLSKGFPGQPSLLCYRSHTGLCLDHFRLNFTEVLSHPSRPVEACR